MPQTEAQKEWRRAKRKEHTHPTVRIDTTVSTKNEWMAYAAFKGLPMSTMIRQCIAEAMQRDGWVYQPQQEE